MIMYQCEKIGNLRVRSASEWHSSRLGIGFEKLDRAATARIAILPMCGRSVGISRSTTALFHAQVMRTVMCRGAALTRRRCCS